MTDDHGVWALGSYGCQWNDNSRFPCFPDTPMHPWQNKGLKEHHGNRAGKHAYSAPISGVHTNLGRILTRLEELGLREQTLAVLRVPQIWNRPGKIRPG